MIKNIFFILRVGCDRSLHYELNEYFLSTAYNLQNYLNVAVEQKDFE